MLKRKKERKKDGLREENPLRIFCCVWHRSAILWLRRVPCCLCPLADMPGALEECCAYFCTGLSVFGVLGLVRAPPSFNSLRTPLCAARQRRGGGLRSARVSQCPPPRPRSSSWATRSSRATTGSSASQRRRANRSLCARPLHPFAGHCEDRLSLASASAGAPGRRRGPTRRRWRASTRA